MARIDSFIAQLVSRGGEALLLEGGNNIFLVKDGAMDPLVDARRGVLQNEHIQTLLRDVAPANHQDAISGGSSVGFSYDSPSGRVAIKTAMRDGKYMARVKVDGSVASGEGAPQTGTRRPASPGSAISVMSSQPSQAPVSDEGDGPAFGARPAFAPRGASIPPPMSVEEPAPSAPPQPSLAAMSAGPPGQKPRAEAWFEIFLRSRASDLHLTSTMPAMLRVDGDMQAEPLIPTLSAEALEAHLKEIMPSRNRSEFDETNDTDFAYEMPGARLRCNVFRDRRGPGAVFRKIPTKILSAKDLNLPPAVTELGKLKKGLVLVTGPTGSGKSTTLAALMDWVNANRTDHNITVEDPI